MSTQMTLPAWLESIGRQPHGTVRRALRDQSGECTYTELVDAAEWVAAGLASLGFERGDRLATAAVPSISHVVLILGALRAGVVPVPLNIRLAPVEAAAFMEGIAPRMVASDDVHLEWSKETGAEVLLLPQMSSVGTLEERLAPLSDQGDAAPPLPDESDLAIIFPTGGTTGSPKGAVHSHRTLWLWLNTVALGNPRSLTDIELCFSPFFHITLGANVLAPLQAGGEVWIHEKFEAGAALRDIDAGASRLMGAPTMFAALRAHPTFDIVRRENVSAIRFGSAPADPSFIDQLLADFPRARIRAGFGATEFGSVMGFDHEDLLAGHFVGVGRPLPGVTVHVIDDFGDEVAPSEVGNLVVSAPWQTLGYYGKPAETEATFQENGVHIGDLVTRSENGWVKVVGRKKEMLVSGGENVFPREVEEALLLSPGVKDAIVYGLDDDYWGERVEAAIVPSEATLDAEAIREFCRDKLAGYKIPKVIRVIESVPLTSNNKPDRLAVRRWAAEQQAALADESK